MFKRFRVSGNSMLPAFKSGDCAISEKISYLFREPRVGEVVILRHPEKNFNLIKRLAQKDGDYYLAAGDGGGKYFIHKNEILSRVL